MKLVHLVVGTVDYENTILFGAYSEKRIAKERCRDVKENHHTYVDQLFLHEMVLDEDTEDHI